MSNDTPSSWQDLPTVVEITDESRRRNQNARNMAAILDDIVDGDEAPKRATQGDSALPIDALLANFRFGGEEVPTLVQSAAPLLNLAHVLRFSDAQPDPDHLRRACMEAITRYERDLASARISPERARAAHYAVCATVDDVILSKPWGVRAGWARSGLVSTFHNDVTGGDRFFDILDHFHQSPGTNKDLLLLIYLCLSLAFEGRTRVSAKGALELSRIRDSLYKTLIGQYGVFERELSPHWQGVEARHTPLRTMAALWTLLSLIALAFAFGYLFFTLTLNSASDATFERLASLPPTDTPSVLIAAAPEPPHEILTKPEEPVIPEQPPKIVEMKPTRLDNLMAFLQPEVQRNLVTLANVNGRLRVRINNSGLFNVGSADVSPQFRDLIQRIGGALAADKFRAVVIGYTDNVPIKTVQFPSNWHLSEARAKAVGDLLSNYTGPDAILTEGRADSDPISDNNTAEGREKNRRTEIMVLTNPGEKLSEAGILSPAVTTTNGQQPGETQQ
ncbi:type VI secretion system protein TssL, long form [Agrobacterium vaccinii]|uniref:type VI secretion system protein TssL, long form n=1 Tax=Agrobacterium vaccinii TaxID=2735528 RepID=UPI001E3C8547|nr:type VI secretion system protein TssL, long form [Agrobacterium vaccinii]UHS59430.1 type VI secretion system protein TssL [Agrobacterium vaccinii]